MRANMEGGRETRGDRREATLLGKERREIEGQSGGRETEQWPGEQEM